MCIGCWIEAGSPRIINEATRQAAKLINDFYELPGASSGGDAHIVIDDWNLEDSNIEYCIESAKKNEFNNSDECQKACLVLLVFLKTLSLEERYSAMALSEEIIE
jgi:hypothetical protein